MKSYPDHTNGRATAASALGFDLATALDAVVDTHRMGLDALACRTGLCDHDDMAACRAVQLAYDAQREADRTSRWHTYQAGLTFAEAIERDQDEALYLHELDIQDRADRDALQRERWYLRHGQPIMPGIDLALVRADHDAAHRLNDGDPRLGARRTRRDVNGDALAA